MELPSPTADLVQAADDLDRTGLAIVHDAVDPALIEDAREQLDRVAADERRTGRAILEDGSAANGRYAPGANQRVLSLLEKGMVFAELATHGHVLSIARRAFGRSYGYPQEVVDQFGFDELRLSSVTANIANDGGVPMMLHTDQGFVPNTEYPIVINALWPLVDLDETNGATEVVPGSHLADPAVMVASPPAATPISAPPGSVILFDGRTWHRTGANRTPVSRPVVLVTYCRPWVRPFDDHIASSSRHLLPVTPWFVYDHANGELEPVA